MPLRDYRVVSNARTDRSRRSTTQPGQDMTGSPRPTRHRVPGFARRPTASLDLRSAARPQNSRKFACMRTCGIRTEAPQRAPRWPPAFGDAIAPNKHVRRCSRSGQSSEPPARRARNPSKDDAREGGSATPPQRVDRFPAPGRRRPHSIRPGKKADPKGSTRHRVRDAEP